MPRLKKTPNKTCTSSHSIAKNKMGREKCCCTTETVADDFDVQVESMTLSIYLSSGDEATFDLEVGAILLGAGTVDLPQPGISASLQINLKPTLYGPDEGKFFSLLPFTPWRSAEFWFPYSEGFIVLLLL